MSLAIHLRPDEQLPITRGEIAGFARDPVDCMRRLHAAHGDVAALQEQTQHLYFVFGPRYTKQVLSDSTLFHSHFFAIRGPRRSAQRRVTTGLLSMNGDEHKQQRRLVMEPFQKRAIAGYHDTIVEAAAETMSGWTPGTVTDINDDMTRHMLRLTSRILFGLNDRELAYEVGELTEQWVALNHRMGPAAFSADADLTDCYDELLEAATRLETAVQAMIRAKRAGPLEHDVLSLLIRIHDATGGVSDDQLIGHIVLLFGAAHLTSAHTLSWTLFLLAQHPEVMSELHAELQSQLNGQPPTLAQLDQLPVLDRVLKESMRVLPASSYSQRVTAGPVELGPFSLKRGSAVIFSQFITHHLPELFPDPDRFLPDRWLTINPSPYAYLPFGAGPRMCIGAALGMMQLKIGLPAFLGKFKFECVPGSEVNGHVKSTMLFPVGPMPLRIGSQDGRFSAHPVGGSIHGLMTLPARRTAHVAEPRRAA